MALLIYVTGLLYVVCLIVNLYALVTIDPAAVSTVKPNVWRITMLGCAYSLIYVLQGMELSGDAALNVWVVVCASQVLFMIFWVGRSERSFLKKRGSAEKT